jgi:hypothetical protein
MNSKKGTRRKYETRIAKTTRTAILKGETVARYFRILFIRKPLQSEMKENSIRWRTKVKIKEKRGKMLKKRVSQNLI